MSATDRIRADIEMIPADDRPYATTQARATEVLALCDLADAARALRHALDKGDYNAAAHRVDRALARLDGEGT